MELKTSYQLSAISYQPKKGFTLIRTLDKSKNLDKVQPYHGFTLIETLVVIGTLSILLLIGSNFFLSTITTGSKSEALKEVRQNGEYASKILEETIKNSGRLVECMPGTYTAGGPFNPPSISVEGIDKNVTIFTLLNDNNDIRIASISGTKNYYLTSNKVTVVSFQLDCGDLILSSGSPPTIIINFSLSQGLLSGPQEKRASMSFSSKVTIRVPREQRVD